MSDKLISVRVSADTRTLEDMIRDLQAKMDSVRRQITEKLQPIMLQLHAELLKWWREYPGMPYTAPSGWYASQMAADDGMRHPDECYGLHDDYRNCIDPDSGMIVGWPEPR